MSLQIKSEIYFSILKEVVPWAVSERSRKTCKEGENIGFIANNELKKISRFSQKEKLRTSHNFDVLILESSLICINWKLQNCSTEFA